MCVRSRDGQARACECLNAEILNAPSFLDLRFFG